LGSLARINGCVTHCRFLGDLFWSSLKGRESR
jgi:hypothetical protein